MSAEDDAPRRTASDSLAGMSHIISTPLNAIGGRTLELYRRRTEAQGGAVWRPACSAGNASRAI
jgi:signal transduction histidine kinase